MHPRKKRKRAHDSRFFVPQIHTDWTDWSGKSKPENDRPMYKTLGFKENTQGYSECMPSEYAFTDNKEEKETGESNEGSDDDDSFFDEEFLNDNEQKNSSFIPKTNKKSIVPPPPSFRNKSGGSSSHPVGWISKSSNSKNATETKSILQKHEQQKKQAPPSSVNTPLVKKQSDPKQVDPRKQPNVNDSANTEQKRLEREKRAQLWDIDAINSTTPAAPSFFSASKSSLTINVIKPPEVKKMKDKRNITFSSDEDGELSDSEQEEKIPIIRNIQPISPQYTPHSKAYYPPSTKDMKMQPLNKAQPTKLAKKK